LVKVLKLQESEGDYKNSDISKPTTPAKDKIKDKQDKLKTSKAKTLSTAKGKARVRLNLIEYIEEEVDSPVMEVVRERIASGESVSRPDSGFASRSETPAAWSEAGSKAGSPLLRRVRKNVKRKLRKTTS